MTDKIHIEYFDGTTYQPLSFNSDGSLFFGPSTGFPLADATTEFRVTFDTNTIYDYIILELAPYTNSKYIEDVAKTSLGLDYPTADQYLYGKWVIN